MQHQFSRRILELRIKVKSRLQWPSAVSLTIVKIINLATAPHWIQTRLEDWRGQHGRNCCAFWSSLVHSGPPSVLRPLLTIPEMSEPTQSSAPAASPSSLPATGGANANGVRQNSLPDSDLSNRLRVRLAHSKSHDGNRILTGL